LIPIDSTSILHNPADTLMAIFRTEQEQMIAASKVRENPVPYADRLAFWQRVKARRAEKQAQREREDMDISRWLAEKAPTPVERWAQEALDGANQWQFETHYPATFDSIKADSITSDHIRAARISWDRDGSVNPYERHHRIFLGVDPGNPDGFAYFDGESSLLNFAQGYDRDPAIISSARRVTRETVEAKIINSVVDVDEVFWDIATMIDAHRNGATALERGAGPFLPAETPVWEELASTKWDPTKERGPREVDYVRKLAKQS
jgi:hypothetical protein